MLQCIRKGPRLKPLCDLKHPIRPKAKVHYNPYGTSQPSNKSNDEIIESCNLEKMSLK